MIECVRYNQRLYPVNRFQLRFSTHKTPLQSFLHSIRFYSKNLDFTKEGSIQLSVRSSHRVKTIFPYLPIATLYSRLQKHRKSHLATNHRSKESSPNKILQIILKRKAARPVTIVI